MILQKNKKVILTQLRLPELHYIIWEYIFSESQVNISDSVTCTHAVFLKMCSCYREPSVSGNYHLTYFN